MPYVCIHCTLCTHPTIPYPSQLVCTAIHSAPPLSWRIHALTPFASTQTLHSSTLHSLSCLPCTCKSNASTLHSQAGQEGLLYCMGCMYVAPSRFLRQPNWRPEVCWHAANDRHSTLACAPQGAAAANWLPPAVLPHPPRLLTPSTQTCCRAGRGGMGNSWVASGVNAVVLLLVSQLSVRAHFVPRLHENRFGLRAAAGPSPDGVQEGARVRAAGRVGR